VGLGLVLLIVLLVLFLWKDCMARPARLTKQNQRRSASIIAIVIKTSSVGGTHSMGIASQRSVGQMTRKDAFLSVLSITWISRPVMISPQTRQYRFSSKERHCWNSSSRCNTASFSSSHKSMEAMSVMAKHLSALIPAQSGERRIGLSV